MQGWLIPLLKCPATGAQLSLEPGEVRDEYGIAEGSLRSPTGTIYAVIRGVPRFVEERYAGGFGLQWNIHDKTQIDLPFRG